MKYQPQLSTEREELDVFPPGTSRSGVICPLATIIPSLGKKTRFVFPFVRALVSRNEMILR